MGEVFWGLLGLAVGLAGIWVGYLLAQRSRLVISIQSWTTVVNDLTSKIAGLQVAYLDVANLKNVVLMSAVIKNVGNVDVDASDIREPLTLKLPGKSRWLTAKLVSGAIQSQYAVNGNSLEITWDIFRQQEQIHIAGLVEICADDLHADGLPLVQLSRIKNTSVTVLPGLDFGPVPVFSGFRLVTMALLLVVFSSLALVVRMPATQIQLLSEGQPLQTYFADDGKVCGSIRSDFVGQTIFGTPKPCEIDLSKQIVSGPVTLKLDVARPNEILGWLGFPAAFFLGLELATRYFAQLRRYGMVHWFATRRVT